MRQATPTVLIVDDSPELRRLHRDTLALEGCRLLETANGHEGVRVFEETRPELVLLDMIMPSGRHLSSGRTPGYLSGIRLAHRVVSILILLVTGSSGLVQGQHVKDGPEFQVNTYTTGIQRYPAVAMADSGDFVVVWHSRDQDGSGWGIFGQRFCRDLDGDSACDPFCDVSMSQPAYVDGEAVVISTLRYANPGPTALDTRMLLQLTLRFGVTVNIVDVNVTLPAGLDNNLGPATLVTLPPGHPRGVWELRCALEDQATGAVQAEDTAGFEFQ
jgi:CheY-like chemotaxis protein